MIIILGIIGLAILLVILYFMWIGLVGLITAIREIIRGTRKGLQSNPKEDHDGQV